MRFTLRWLFIVILLIAISVVALLNANTYWAGAARTTMFLILPLSVVIALASGGTTRLFWFGFAIVGAVQFWSLGFARGAAAGESLVEPGIQWLHSKVVRDVDIEVPVYREGNFLRMDPRVVPRPNIDYFRVVGHCVVAALFGVLGGCVGAWVYSCQNVRAGRPSKVSDNVTDHT
jgi:hypothetical protein